MKIFPGDIITTSYYLSRDTSDWHCKGRYKVIEILDNGPFLTFKCLDVDNPNDKVCGAYSYLNGYEYIDGKYLRVWSVNIKNYPSRWERLPESEFNKVERIVILKQKEQTELFV